MTTTANLCGCGKPAEHVNADPDSPEWACRVPYPAGDLERARQRDEAIKRARQAGYDKGYRDALSATPEDLKEAEQNGYDDGFDAGHKVVTSAEEAPIDDYDAGFQAGAAAGVTAVSYRVRVAQAIAEVVSQRHLTLDQLAQVADALGVPASSLLPQHLTTAATR